MFLSHRDGYQLLLAGSFKNFRILNYVFAVQFTPAIFVISLVSSFVKEVFGFLIFSLFLPTSFKFVYCVFAYSSPLSLTLFTVLLFLS